MRVQSLDGEVHYKAEVHGEAPTFISLFHSTSSTQYDEYYLVTFSELQAYGSLNDLFITHLVDKKSSIEAKEYYVNFGNLGAEDLYISDVVHLDKSQQFMIADKAGSLLVIKLGPRDYFEVVGKFPLPETDFSMSAVRNIPVDVEVHTIDEEGLTTVVVATQYTDIYKVEFNQNNLVADPVWTYYS